MVWEHWRRSVMRRAALRFTDHGWPVVPGAPLIGGRYACSPLCPTVACHPALEDWENRATVDQSDVDEWWSAAAFSVLLATGHSFDVIEVPGHLGSPATRHAALGPVAVAPSGRWMFFVQTGDTLRPELDERLDVVLHAAGSWVPAPPTRSPIGNVRWAVHPGVTGWRLPDPYAVQRVLVTDISSRGRTPTFATTSARLRRA
jgi:hypothetical protein